MRIVVVILAIATITVFGVAARADAPTAEDLYIAGQQDYDAGNFTDAVKLWEESYALSKEPALLFNIAQAKRQSGDCPEALTTYRRFITADPTSEQKPLAEDLVRELEDKCGTKAKPPEPPKPMTLKPTVDQPKLGNGLNLVDRLNDPKDRSQRPGQALRIAGLVISGTGTTLLVSGLVLGHHGQAIGDEVTFACSHGCDWSAQKDKDAAGRRDVTIGHVLDVAGVATILGGATLYYFGYREDTIMIEPTPPRDHGAIVTWSGSW